MNEPKKTQPAKDQTKPATTDGKAPKKETELSDEALSGVAGGIGAGETDPSRKGTTPGDEGNT